MSPRPEPASTSACSPGARRSRRSPPPWPIRARARRSSRRSRPARSGLIEPLLVGPAATIEQVARKAGLDLGRARVVDAPDAPAAARKAVELVREGQAELLMKGSLHTDELLAAVVARETGLRTGRRISHVFIMDVPTYHKVLMVTDAAINIAPTLEDKVDICQNAIDLVVSLGVDQAESRDPGGRRDGDLEDACHHRRGLRSARWPSAARSPGRLLDGPLAFDNAISKQAAKTKKIESEVAGDPDILLAPDLEAGNILAKQLSFLANADSAGLVLGARVPIILTSRADSVRSKIASCAVGVLAAHARRKAATGQLGAPMSDYAARPERRLLEPEVLRLPALGRRGLDARCAGPDRGYRHEAAAVCEGRRVAPKLVDQTLGRSGARRARRARRARGLAPLPLRRGPRGRRRTPRRPRRRQPRGAGCRHARGPRGPAGAGPARAAPSALQPRRDRRGLRAHAGRAAGRVLRHELSPRAARRRRARAAARRHPREGRAALWLPRPVVRVHRLGAAGDRPGRSPRGA